VIVGLSRVGMSSIPGPQVIRPGSSVSKDVLSSSVTESCKDRSNHIGRNSSLAARARSK
jgi:hypothetical protein